MKNKLRAWLVFLIFLNGYVSLSLELVVLRQLSFYVGSSPVITSIIMGTFLGFMSLGYFLGESKKIPNKRIRDILSASFIIVAVFTLLAASFPLITNYFTAMAGLGITSGVIQTFIFSFLLLSIGPFLFGFNTTLLSRSLYRFSTNYTGNIMAWDTIGSVLGSMATTLFLMPFLGVNYTVVLVIGLAITASIITRVRWTNIAIGAVIIASALLINSNAYLRRTYGILVNNANSTISIKEYDDARVLDMNGLAMSIYSPTTGGTAPYIDYINGVYLYTLPRDRVRNILVLGAGGFTAGLEDTYHNYTFVDIEHTLKEVSEKHFLNREIGANKRFVVQDASQFLKNTTQQYDVILLDVYSNSYQIPEGLITAEFMHRVKSRLAPGGVVLMNVIGSVGFDDNFSRVFDNTFHTVFTHNTQRQVIGYINPWGQDDSTNMLYVYYDVPNNGRIYTINKTPVIYDK